MGYTDVGWFCGVCVCVCVCAECVCVCGAGGGEGVCTRLHAPGCMHRAACTGHRATLHCEQQPARPPHGRERLVCLPTPWQYIILGCTVGGLLLAMLTLLAYQIHLHRG